MFCGSDVRAGFQRFPQRHIRPCVSEPVCAQRYPAVPDCYHQLCGKSVVSESGRKASGYVRAENGGTVGDGNLGAVHAVKRGVRQLYLHSDLHVFCAGSIDTVKYHSKYFNTGGFQRICGADGEYFLLYSGNRNQRQPVCAGTVWAQLSRV